MTPDVQILLSGTLTFGVPLALAIRDLLKNRRGSGGDGWPPQPQTPPPQPNAGSPPIQRALPACLIPVRGTPQPEARPRVREFA